MKKVNVFSVENRLRYLKNDYVIEANLNGSQCGELAELLDNAVKSKVIEGFEFTAIRMPWTICLDNIVLTDDLHKIKALSRDGAYGLCVYGRNARNYLKEIVNIIQNEYKLNTKTYQLV